MFDLDSPHKKTYETLIIGKYFPFAMETVNNLETHDLGGPKNGLQAFDQESSAENGNQTDTKSYSSRSCDNHDNKGHVPDNRVIISVPCSLHSKKPPLMGMIFFELFIFCFFVFCMEDIMLIIDYF